MLNDSQNEICMQYQVTPKIAFRSRIPSHSI